MKTITISTELCGDEEFIRVSEDYTVTGNGKPVTFVNTTSWPARLCFFDIHGQPKSPFRNCTSSFTIDEFGQPDNYKRCTVGHFHGENSFKYDVILPDSGIPPLDPVIIINGVQLHRYLPLLGGFALGVAAGIGLYDLIVRQDLYKRLKKRQAKR